MSQYKVIIKEEALADLKNLCAMNLRLTKKLLGLLVNFTFIPRQDWATLNH